MPAPSVTAALLAALAASAAPAKQSWDSAVKPGVEAWFLPHSALVEVDGRAQGRGVVRLEIADPKRKFQVRVSAEGFETEEAVVEAGQVANRLFILALRPVGFARRIDPGDAAGVALAAAALWRAGRADDAAQYAEASLKAGNAPLAHRVLGDVWRSRGDRDQATRHYTMYLSLTQDPPDAREIEAWLMQPRPGDITVPER